MTRCLACACLLLLLANGTTAIAAQDSAVPYQAVSTAEQAIAAIEKLGGSVRRLTQKGTPIEVDLQFATEHLRDEHLQYLLTLHQITVLRLKGTAITDAGLVHVGKIASLQRLHLDGTRITDTGLKHLQGLKELETLNLYATKVTDAGLAPLKQLPKLKQLFVGETAISRAGIASLKSAISGLRVVPDPEIEQARAKLIWQRSKENLVAAEGAVSAAKSDVELLAPKSAQLKKEADEATKRFNDLKKVADELKKKSDEATKRFNDLKKVAEDLQRQAKNKPTDGTLQKQVEEKKKQLEAERSLSEEMKNASEDAQKKLQTVQQALETARKMFSRASNASRTLAEAKETLEGCQKAEEAARKRLAEYR